MEGKLVLVPGALAPGERPPTPPTPTPTPSTAPPGMWTAGEAGLLGLKPQAAATEEVEITRQV